jgi:plastocyanin
MERSLVRRSAGWLATVVSVAVAACGGDDGTGPGGGGGGGGGSGGGTPVITTSVTVTTGLSFDPQHIQVSPNASVTWTWAAQNQDHNVTFPSASIADSPTQAAGTFTTAMPAAAGVYNYACTIHGGMSGTVTVS